MHNRHVRMAVLAALSSASAFVAGSAAAGEIAFDGTLPGTAAGALDAVNDTYSITQNRGFLNGSNLFHSFAVFNLSQGDIAVFSGNSSITNIISRVTGGTPTTLDGTLRSSIAGANFWFVNPAGLTIGPTGTIDVSGAVALGAADYIGFANGEKFYALPHADELTAGLLVASPVDFGFLEGSVAGALVIQNTGVRARSVAANQMIQPPGSSPADPGYAMLLSGGTGVSMHSDGDLNLQDVRVRTGSGSMTGPVEIRAAGAIDMTHTDIKTSMGVAGRGGDILIQGGELVTISRSSVVAESLEAGVNTGNVSISGAGISIRDQSLVANEFRAGPPLPIDPDDDIGPINARAPGPGSISILATGHSTAAVPPLESETAADGVIRIVDSAVGSKNAGGRNFPDRGGIRIGRVDEFDLEDRDLPLDPEEPFLPDEPIDPDEPASPGDREPGIEALFGADQVVIAGSVIATDATAEGAADDILIGGRNGVWITPSSTGGYRADGNLPQGGSWLSARASTTARDAGQISVLAGAGGITIERSTLDTTSAITSDPEFFFETRFDFDAVLPFDIVILALGHIEIDHATLLAGSTGFKSGGDIGLYADTVRVDGGLLSTAVNTLRPTDQHSSDYDAGDIAIFAANRFDSARPLRVENGAVLRATSTDNGNPLTDPIGASAGFIDLMSPRGSIEVVDARLETASDGTNGDNAGQVTLLALTDIDVVNTVIDAAALSQNPNAFNDLTNVGGIRLDADEGSTRIAGSQFSATSTAVGRSGEIELSGTTIDIANSSFESSSGGIEGGAAEGISISAGGLFETGTSVRISNSSFTASSIGSPFTVGADISISTGAGDIDIDHSSFNASVLSDGSIGDAFGGLLIESSISIFTGRNGTLRLTDSSLRSTTSSEINGGAISLGGDAIVIRGSTLSTSSDTPRVTLPAVMDPQDPIFGPQQGNAGSIAIGIASFGSDPDPSRLSITIESSSITTDALANRGGNISINGGAQLVVRDSNLVASAGGSGSSGNIDISNIDAIALHGSSVLALAESGTAGTVDIALTENSSGALLIDSSRIATNASNAAGGSIALDGAGKQVQVMGSAIVASAGGNGQGGDVAIRNAASTSLQDSQIQALANTGNGGTVSITQMASAGGPLQIQNTQIAANANAANGGDISLDAGGSGLLLSGASLIASAGGAGVGGDITIRNVQGAILQDSQIQALANAGNGGTISVVLDGAGGPLRVDNSSITTNAASANGGNITLQAAGNQVVLRGSTLVASAGGAGTGGGISILNASGATLQNTQLQALANAGAGGTISIDVTDNGGAMVLDNSSITTNATSANGGNITLDAAGNQVVLRSSSIVASAGGSGAGGDISIRNASGATLMDSQIQALANAGPGGTINLALSNGAATPVVIQSSAITTNAVAAGGGNITLDAGGSPLLLRDSTIRASAGAAGTGGNVLIDKLDRTIMQRSQVLARADAGNGGTITLNLVTGALFLRDAQSLISADSNSGSNGKVDINSPDTDLNPAVKPQDASLADAPELSANTCTPATKATRSTFVSDGRGGVGASPDGYLVSIPAPAAAQRAASVSEASTSEERVAMAVGPAIAPGCR